MTLRLVRLPVKTDALGRWAAERGLGWSGRHYDEGAALHHLLGECFGAAALQPFRLLTPPTSTMASLYAYSLQTAVELRETARASMMPEMESVTDLSRIEDKTMPESWTEGQRLGFDLRLRSVVRLASAVGKHGKGDECDAYLAEALREHDGNTGGMEQVGRTREVVYRDWLTARLGKTAEIQEDCRLVRFARRRVVGGRRGIEGPDAVMQGTLIVGDPVAFADLLARGVGRHRSYGFGMVLLRPPGRPVPRR